jgi:hypothetical protein
MNTKMVSMVYVDVRKKRYFSKITVYVLRVKIKALQTLKFGDDITSHVPKESVL